MIPENIEKILQSTLSSEQYNKVKSYIDELIKTNQEQDKKLNIVKETVDHAIFTLFPHKYN